MPDVVTHPTTQELDAFGLGKLPERAAAAVAAHMESCPTCRMAVANVPPDSFLGKVRAAVGDTASFPGNSSQPLNTPNSEAQPATPIVPCPDIPSELARHPKYLILRELGRGGMGIVYQARHKEMDRQVVIKVVNRSLLDRPDSLERFRREIRSAAQLSHPNIVTAYDAEQAGESDMLVMEFVPGQSLAEILEKKGPLPVDIACQFARQVALGLQHAHERNMVHRDIKPQNLMLAPEGQVKILDFGLAKVISERETGRRLTSSGDYMGTPEYSAPEQAEDASKADIRADLYSLGCTLYCLLAGCPPFRQDTKIKTILAHREKAPQPLPELRPDVPAELWQVVARLLAKEPAQRYQKPIEVVQALAPFVKPGERQEAKEGAVLPLGVGSPGKGIVFELKTSEVKKIPQDVSVKEPPKEMPGKEEASQFADLEVGASLKLTRAPKRNGRKGCVLTVAVSASLALALIVWASGVFMVKVKTPEGTIVLEHLPADADVMVDGAKVRVTWGDGGKAHIRVQSGKHRIEAKKDGFTIYGEEVEIEDGKRRILTAKLSRPSPTPVISPIDPPKPSAIPPVDSPKPPLSDITPKGAPSAEVKEVGSYVALDQWVSVLLQRQGEAYPWAVLRPEGRVSTACTLVSLPGYRSLIALDSGPHLTLWGNLPEFSALPPVLESVVMLHVPSPGIDLDFTLDRGRVLIVNRKTPARPVHVRLRFLRESWELELPDDQSEAVVELWTLARSAAAGATPQQPVACLGLFTKGSVKVKTARKSLDLSDRSRLSWVSQEPAELYSTPLTEPPAWWAKQPERKDQGVQKALRSLLDWSEWLAELKEYPAKRKRPANETPTVVERIKTLVEEEENDADNQDVGVFFLAALDETEPLMGFLEGRQNANVRGATLFALQSWLSRGSQHASELARIIECRRGYSKDKAERIVGLLHFFPPESLEQKKTYEDLISCLDDDSRLLRDLAFWHLGQLGVGGRLPEEARKIDYDPAWKREQRRPAVEQWKKLLREGKVPSNPAR